MQWVGYTPYEDFIRRLTVTNPTRAAIEEMSPQEYRVAAASVPFTNNPSRASSTFVRRIRYTRSHYRMSGRKFIRSLYRSPLS